MDFTSIEFYTIAFCVAMGLLGFFLGQKRTKPASSHIDALDLEPAAADSEQDTGTIKFTAAADGSGAVTIERRGMRLVDGETVNLIATIVDDKLTIEEKKGMVSAFGGSGRMMDGKVVVDYIPADVKVYVRYESSVTGQWCKFAFKNTPRYFIEREMRY